jgi:hypothetical protein
VSYVVGYAVDGSSTWEVTPQHANDGGYRSGHLVGSSRAGTFIWSDTSAWGAYAVPIEASAVETVIGTDAYGSKIWSIELTYDLTSYGIAAGDIQTLGCYEGNVGLPYTYVVYPVGAGSDPPRPDPAYPGGTIVRQPGSIPIDPNLGSPLVWARDAPPSQFVYPPVGPAWYENNWVAGFRGGGLVDYGTGVFTITLETQPPYTDGVANDGWHMRNISPATLSYPNGWEGHFWLYWTYRYHNSQTYQLYDSNSTLLDVLDKPRWGDERPQYAHYLSPNVELWAGDRFVLFGSSLTASTLDWPYGQSSDWATLTVVGDTLVVEQDVDCPLPSMPAGGWVTGTADTAAAWKGQVAVIAWHWVSYGS